MPKKSNYFNGKKFYNPTIDFEPNVPFFAALRMWYSMKKATWPKSVTNIAIPKLDLKLQPNDVAITFVNHATFLIQVNGLNILTDPIWSKRCSPIPGIGPKRVRAPGITFKNLPNIDLVLISHNHYDHLDIPTVRKLNKKFTPQFVVPIGKDKALLESVGCKKVQELDWWQSLSINDRTTIYFTPTQHFSARTLFDKYESLWGAYVICSNNKKIYFGGDAGYSRYYKDTYNKLGAMDLALLGIGAYEPRWFMKNMHTNPAEAVQAHLDLHSKNSIAMHYGTFQLSAEAIDQPQKDLLVAIKEFKVSPDSFIILPEGKTQVYS